MTKLKTINRGWLKRQVEAGKMEAKCDSRYTDDYAWDSATNYGATEWKPAKEMNFDQHDFSWRGGGAYQEESGIIRMYGAGETHSFRLLK